MQLGISTYSFPWAVGIEGFSPANPISILELLNYAHEKGISRVQIGDNMPLHKFSSQEIENLKVTADELGIGLEVGTRRLEQDNILTYLEIAKQLNSPFLRIVIDDADFHPEEIDIIETITKLLPHFEVADIILAIENHDRFPAKMLANIIEKTNSDWVGICLDTANSLGANEGVEQVLKVLSPYTVNLHIKDIKIKRVHHKMGFEVEGCTAGEGILNIPEIISHFKESGKCLTATLELWSNPEKIIEETILKEKEWVDKSLNYLKQIIS